MNLQRLWYKLENTLNVRRRRWRHRAHSLASMPGLEDAKIVFVIASPRSGTTWLQRALNEHPEITCGENRLFGSWFDVVSSGSDNKLRITLDHFAGTMAARTAKQDLALLPTDYKDDLTMSLANVAFQKWRQWSGKRILVDKVTPYPGTAAEVIRKIRQFFPGARIIQLIRDGRDVLTSGVFHWLNRTVDARRLTPGQERRLAFFSTGNATQTLDRFFTDHEIEEWGNTWQEPVDALRMQVGNDILQIRYEHMIADLAAELKRICSHIGANDRPSLLSACVEASSFVRMSGGRKRGVADNQAHVRKGVVGDWQHYMTRQDGQLFHQICGQSLVQFGYADDDTWWDQLPGSLDLQEAA